MSKRETGKPRCVLWLRPEQAALAHEVVEAAGLVVESVGSPEAGAAVALAESLRAPSGSDLRATLAETRASLVLMLDPGDLGVDMRAAEFRALREARARGVRLLSLEPVPATVLSLASHGDEPEGTGVETVRFTPLLRDSRRFREAADVVQQFGRVRTLSIEVLGSPTTGSLGAMLYSGLDLVHALLGVPETLDATYVSTQESRGLIAVAGDTLRGLGGDLTAMCRFADGRCATIVASDHAARWNRTITLLGASGRLRIYDDGFELLDPAGKKVDEARQRRTSKSLSHATAAIVDAVERALDPHAASTRPVDELSVLSAAQAALLSTRTGQPESPETIRRMVGRES